MARGNEIIVSSGSGPRGVFHEGYIATAQTPKPGTIMEIDFTVALKGGRWTYKVFDGAADGANATIFVLLPDHLRGMTATDAYAAGDRCFLYVPAAGEELNVLVLNLAGTTDDHPLGEILMVDKGTGKLIVTAGSPESEPFQLLEVITDPTEDTLAWVMYTGG